MNNEDVEDMHQAAFQAGLIAQAGDNAVKLGYEINRVLLLLNVLWWFHVEQADFVAGAAFVVVSLACAYFAEAARVLRGGVAGGPVAMLSLGAIVCTAAAGLCWLIGALTYL